MDIDASADDFFAALNSGGADDFVDFGLAPVPDTPSAAVATAAVKADDTLARKKSDAAAAAAGKKIGGVVKKEAAGARAQPKPRNPDEPVLPMEERIVNLLVPELKVNDVMLLIKKMKQAGKSDADEFSELDAEQKTGAFYMVAA